MTHPTLNQAKEPIGHSQFYMWRCIIAIGHADGVMHEAERAYLNRIIGNMDRAGSLTEEQKKTFAEDMEKPQNIAELLKHINDPQWRGQLLYFGGLLARADGELHPDEDMLLKKLHAEHMATLDMDSIRAAATAAVKNETFMHDLEMSELRPQKGLSAILDAFLLHLGIDLLD